MNETLITIITALVCLGIGLYIGNLLARLKNKGENASWQGRLEQAKLQEEKLNVQFDSVLKEREEIRKEKDFLNLELTKRNAEFDNLEAKLRDQSGELEKLNEKFTKEFENLANKILDNKSEKFTKQNKENIDTILKPLQDKIEKFEKKVEFTNKESIDRHAMLRQQIIGLKELNEQMSKEATNLTKALKGDNKIQGNWGELVLERVLEKKRTRKRPRVFRSNQFYY